MEERNTMTKTFVEKAVVNMDKHIEVKSSPRYFWDDSACYKTDLDNKDKDLPKFPSYFWNHDEIEPIADNLNKTYKEMLKVIDNGNDDVNNPKHYNTEVFPQVIDMMLKSFDKADVMAFCKLNAFKYRLRAGIKDANKIEQDIQKAIWYETKFKELKNSNSDKQMILG